MNFVKDILDFLRQFWPFEIVYSYQRGVRFWLGRDTALLEPGLYFNVPFFGHIETVAVQPDLIRLADQTLTTRDGKTVIVNANVLYHVEDARAAYCNVQEFTNSLGDAARVYLAQSIRDFDYAALLESQTELEEACAAAVNEAAEDWGVVVDRVGLASFAFTRSFALANV